MTQRERVLAALRRAGEKGITAAAFQPPTVDGGKPIMRVAARILELRQDGHPVEPAGWVGELRVYRLQEPVSDTVPAVSGTNDDQPGGVAEGTLFDLDEAA